MAAGGGAGVITVWDLEKRRLSTVVRDAHDAPVTALHFFAGEPRLMSAGGDNAIKQWVFDAADGSARLLRFRSGHAAPPTVVRYYGEAGTRLLSAGGELCLSAAVSFRFSQCGPLWENLFYAWNRSISSYLCTVKPVQAQIVL